MSTDIISSIVESFRVYLQLHSTSGSNMPGSYVQSIHKLNVILKGKTDLLGDDEDLWLFTDGERLGRIYQAVLAAQRQADGGFFKGTRTPSYWRQYFYSSALKMLSSFLLLHQRQKQMLALAASATDAKALASELSQVELPVNPLYWDDEVSADSLVGKERLATIKQRENQYVFREMILRQYQFQCCLCGLSVVGTLRASHISAWAKDVPNRLNPENGLCLSATYDAAFDRYLISFDEDYRLVLAPSLREHLRNQAFQEQFKKLEGKQINLPVKFCPSQELLAQHREQLR